MIDGGFIKVVFKRLHVIKSKNRSTQKALKEELPAMYGSLE